MIFFKKNTFDIVHINNNYLAGVLCKAAHKNNIKIIIVHNHTNFGEKSFINKKLIQKFATNKISVSKDTMKSIFTYKAIKNNEIITIYNPIDLNIFDFKEYPKIKKDYWTLVHVGSFNSNKNQLFLIDICKEINKYHITKLFLVGFGDYYKKIINKKIIDLNMQNLVYVLEADTNIPQLLSSADVFVFPSYKEGFGIVLLEAQAMRLKCFVSDTITKETNFGLCTYLSLNNGAKYWAENIIYYLDSEEKENVDINLEECSLKFFAKKILKIYNGEKTC